MRASRAVGVLAWCATIIGCSESTVIRTSPPGARVYVNGQLKGLTPLLYTASRSEFRKGDFRVRVERDGYRPTEGTLATTVCIGRIIGAGFTLGILFLFRGPTCFPSTQDIPLAALPGQGVAGSAGSQPLSVDERLQRLRRMRDQGTITNEEYERHRAEILKDL